MVAANNAGKADYDSVEFFPPSRFKQLLMRQFAKYAYEQNNDQGS